jgi:hypothetical protein
MKAMLQEVLSVEAPAPPDWKRLRVAVAVLGANVPPAPHS